MKILKFIIRWTATLKRFHMALVFCLMMLFMGCATLQGPPQQQACDPQADAAVTNGQWDIALSAHEALLSREPRNCLAMYHLGYIWGRMGERDKEIDLYRQAIACGYDGDAQLYFNLGMALGDTGDLEGALGAFERAVAIDPRNAENYFGLGLMAQASGRDAQAEEALRKAIALSPVHLEARLLLSRIYLDQSRWTEAREQLETVLRQEPGYPEAEDLWQIMIQRQREAYNSGDR
jgi:tetratricopeptide (TPR) repeat protein